MAPRMEWTDEMIELLLHAVFKAGLHTKFHKVGVADEWKELTQELFQMKAFSSSAAYNVVNVERNFKKKYHDVLTNLRREIATGNLSGLEGERTGIYQIAESIDNDLELLAETKKNGVELKRALNEREAVVLSERKKPMKGWGARKSLDGEVDGSVTSSSSSVTNPSPAIQTPNDLFHMFMAEEVKARKREEAAVATPVAAHFTPATTEVFPTAVPPPEEIVEMKMLDWIEEQGKNIGDVVFEANVSDVASLNALDSIGMDVIVGRYCSRGKNFLQDPFEEYLQKHDVDSLAASKIDSLMQRWHRTVMQTDKK